jgi:hypothetical protein
MPTTSSDLWIHWLKLMTDRHEDLYIGADIGSSVAIVRSLALNKIDQQRALRYLDNSINRLARFYAGLTFVAESRTLKESLFAASNMLNRSFDIDLSPDCNEFPSHCPSMPIILMMLLRSQLASCEDKDRIFIEVLCTSAAYRIFIAPNRDERGADWPDITPRPDQSGVWRPAWKQEWPTAVASELANSGHSFTVRSKGALSTFLIEFPHEEGEEIVVFD